MKFGQSASRRKTLERISFCKMNRETRFTIINWHKIGQELYETEHFFQKKKSKK